VTTASDATAVQIVHKRGRRVVGIDHIGTAHEEDRLTLLLEAAKQRLHTDQQVLELDVAPPQPADPGTPWSRRRSWRHRFVTPVGRPVRALRRARILRGRCTGTSISKIVKTLRPLRSATITLGARQIAVPVGFQKSA
jgi:hypothetical protein